MMRYDGPDRNIKPNYMDVNDQCGGQRTERPAPLVK